MVNGPQSLYLDDSNITVSVDPADNNKITGISINGGGTFGADYLAVRVDIIGDGSGAEVEASLDENGSINRFTVVQNGTGYSANNTDLLIVPIVRSIGLLGEEANIEISTLREFKYTLWKNVFVSQEISLKLGFAGKPQGGSGYIIALCLKL